MPTTGYGAASVGANLCDNFPKSFLIHLALPKGNLFRAELAVRIRQKTVGGVGGPDAESEWIHLFFWHLVSTYPAWRQAPVQRALGAFIASAPAFLEVLSCLCCACGCIGLLTRAVWR